MSKIAICGLGNFGTALARTWLVAGHSVSAWTVEEDVAANIEATSINEKYLPGISLPNLQVSTDLGKAIAGAEFVVLALPSHIVLQVVKQLPEHLPAASIVLDLAKGLSENEQLISHEIQQIFDQAGVKNSICVMMGPTIAPELARGVQTLALVASEDAAVAEQTALALSTATMKLSAAKDPLGAEYWGAFKNVIALACGVADGLKDSGTGGDNLKAAIFTCGFREAAELLPKLGAEPATAFSAAGIGDLFVTATSPVSRNRTTGEQLGRGVTLESAQSKTVMVSEGIRATRMFERRFETMKLNAPFVKAVSQLISGACTAEEFASNVTHI